MTGRSRRPVGLEGGERLVAVHLRHDDVEENDVDRWRVGVAQHGQRFAPVGRFR